MLFTAGQSAISLKLVQVGLASIQKPVHTLVMQLYPLCKAQLLTQGIAHRYLPLAQVLGAFSGLALAMLCGLSFVGSCFCRPVSALVAWWSLSSHLLSWAERACSSLEPALQVCARVPLSHPGSF